MRRAHVIGTASVFGMFPARVLPASHHFAVNGQCFAFHPVEAPTVEPITTYRVRGVA